MNAGQRIQTEADLAFEGRTRAYTNHLMQVVDHHMVQPHAHQLFAPETVRRDGVVRREEDGEVVDVRRCVQGMIAEVEGNARAFLEHGDGLRLNELVVVDEDQVRCVFLEDPQILFVGAPYIGLLPVTTELPWKGRVVVVDGVLARAEEILVVGSTHLDTEGLHTGGNGSDERVPRRREQQALHPCSVLITRAGLPATIVYGATCSRTTAPAPITAPSPMRKRGRMIAPA